MSLAYLKAIRLEELKSVLHAIAKQNCGCGTLLEIGAGSGWQAKELANHGHSVFAIDVPGSRHEVHRVWPVIRYDGNRLPFQDASFDVVFSSNVLEHVKSLDTLEQEIHRVLKSSGVAIHVLPSPYWRIWTSLGHYLYILKFVALALIRRSPQSLAISRNPVAPRHSPWKLIQYAMWPSRHGERGNSLSEILLFRKSAWRKHFIDCGWKTIDYHSLGLFYTGNGVIGPLLSVSARQRLSRALGSATSVFVLRQNKDDNHEKYGCPTI